MLYSSLDSPGLGLGGLERQTQERLGGLKFWLLSSQK